MFQFTKRTLLKVIGFKLESMLENSFHLFFFSEFSASKVRVFCDLQLLTILKKVKPWVTIQKPGQFQTNRIKTTIIGLKYQLKFLH